VKGLTVQQPPPPPHPAKSEQAAVSAARSTRLATRNLAHNPNTKKTEQAERSLLTLRHRLKGETLNTPSTDLLMDILKSPTLKEQEPIPALKEKRVMPLLREVKRTNLLKSQVSKGGNQINRRASLALAMVEVVTTVMACPLTLPRLVPAAAPLCLPHQRLAGACQEIPGFGRGESAWSKC
jgi:hypothetical protein